MKKLLEKIEEFSSSNLGFTIVILFCLVVILTSGCAPNRDSDNNGFSKEGEPMITTALGFKINHQKFPPNYYNSRVRLDLSSKVDDLWLELQNCVGLNYDLPSDFLIEYKFIIPDGPNGESRVGHISYTYKNTDSPSFEAYSEISIWDSTPDSTMWITKHEMLHLILAMSGITGSANHDHESEYWNKCLK